MRGKLSTLFVALVVAPIFGAGAATAQTRWDLPTPFSAESFQTRNISEFVKDVETRTSGSLKITVHPAQSLIRHSDIKDAVRRGVVPIGEILASRLEGENPIFGADTLPFLVNGYEGTQKLLQARRPIIQKIFEPDRLVPLFSVPWPAHGLYVRKELSSMDDFKGAKFRRVGRSSEQLAQRLGATPVQIDAGDLGKAFAEGRVDMAFGPASTGADTFPAEAPVIFYDLQAYQPFDLVMVNKGHFDGLTEGERRALTEASAAAETRGWEMSKAEMKDKTDALAKKGIRVLPAPDWLRQGLVEASRLVVEDWAKAAGADGKAILDAIAKK